MALPRATSIVLILASAALGCATPATTRMDAVFPWWEPPRTGVDAFVASFAPPPLDPSDALTHPIGMPIEFGLEEIWTSTVVVVMQRGVILSIDGEARRMIVLLNLPFVAPPLFVELHEDTYFLEMSWLHDLYELDAESRMQEIRRPPALSHTPFPLDEIALQLLSKIRKQAGGGGWRWLQGHALPEVPLP